MRKKIASPPKPFWTLMDTFRPQKSEDLRAMEFDATNRLDYMASRLRAILMALSTRKNYNHAFWYEMVDYEMVFVLGSLTCIRPILSVSDNILYPDWTRSDFRSLCTGTFLDTVNWTIAFGGRRCGEGAYIRGYASIPCK
jgi:hypothetical protein